ncbi:MAG: SAM-dependent chlorinase/fluorinase [Bacteroidota bacterium]
MSIITITTDLGYRDPYLAMVKGILYSKQPNAHIVDLACDVNAHAHNEGAFALRSALPYFSADTVHLFAIKFLNSTDTIKNLSVDNTRYLLTRYKEQYIVCPDNGVLTLIDKTFNEPVYQLYFDNEKQHSFYLRDIFAEIASKLINNTPLDEFCAETREYCKLYAFESFSTPSNLQGMVLYEDDFGNLITSITRKEFETNVGNKRFSIALPSGDVTKIFNTYDDVKIGDVVCFFNSMDLLEISLLGQAANKLAIKKSVLSKYKIERIIVDIYD